MTNDEIRELIQLVVESGVAELEVQRGEDRVRIRRTIEKQEYVMPAAGQPTTAAQATIVETGQTSPPAPNANEHIVKSPIVGTYYDAPKPGDPAFVKVGDTIEPGQVLCIIESMKLMNEIESEVAGTVVAKLMENGRPVEYGAPLFTIRPL
jgi:acetyl-CoA carboxylase biotin carboxyl carrier protein